MPNKKKGKNNKNAIELDDSQNSINNSRNEFMRQLNNGLNKGSDDTNNEEESSWGGVLTGNVKTRVVNPKRISHINSSSVIPDNPDSSPSPVSSNDFNDDNINYGYGYPKVGKHSKMQSFISYTENHSSDEEEDENSKNENDIMEHKNINNNNDNNQDISPSDISQSPENEDYDETDSSSSSVDIDDIMANNDPMLLNIINMSINNYKKNEQSNTPTPNQNTSIPRDTSADSTLSRHSYSGGNLNKKEKKTIGFQQNPIIINEEDEQSQTRSYSSENISQSSSVKDIQNLDFDELIEYYKDNTSAETWKRTNTCKEYLETRYNFIMGLITNEQVYNPLSVMRWRTREWIRQATQGHINTLKKHKNQDCYWFIDNYEIIEFQKTYNKKIVESTNNTNTSANTNTTTAVDATSTTTTDTSATITANNNNNINDLSNNNNTNNTNVNINTFQNNNNINNSNDDSNIGRISNYNHEISHLKTSSTDTNLNGMMKEANKLYRNSADIESINKRISLPPSLHNKKLFNDDIISSYNNSSIKINSEGKDNNNELSISTSNKNEGIDNNNDANSPKEDDDSLMNLFIPKANNRILKKPALSIVTNSVHNSANGINSDPLVPLSAPVIETHYSINRPPKLSSLAEHQATIDSDESPSTPNLHFNKNNHSNNHLLHSRNRFSEIPSSSKNGSLFFDNNNSNEKEDENGSHFDISYSLRRRRSSMPNISHIKQHSFILSNNDSNKNKKSKEKSGLSNVPVENSLRNINCNYSSSNLETPTSTKNPLRKMLLRKREKQYEAQDNAEDTLSNTKFNNMDLYCTSSNLSYNNNSNLQDSKSIKKLFNMDTKGFRSIIKDMPKRSSLTKNDLIHSLSSFNNNNDDNNSTVNLKVTKENGESNSVNIKKNGTVDDKKKKRNILKRLIRNKRNSDIIYQSESEFEDNAKRELINNSEYFNDVDDDYYSNNTDDDDSYYEKRYNEILEDSQAKPNIKFDFTNSEFINNNKLLFNCRILLTDNPPQIIHKYYSNDPFSKNTDFDDLNDLYEKYKTLQIKYQELNDNIILSINYNLYQANKTIYNFMKELNKLNNLETFQVKNIVKDLDNPENEDLLTDDIMDKEKNKKKKNDENSKTSDLINENPTIITSEISRRKSVINRIYNVKNRSFLFKSVATTEESDYDTDSSAVSSPLYYEEQEDNSDFFAKKRANRRRNRLPSIKMDAIMEFNNKEPSLKSPLSIDSSLSPTSINNGLYKRNSYGLKTPYEYSRERSFSISGGNNNTKPYSKKVMNDDIKNINNKYNDLETITKNMHNQYEINSNKIDTIVNETRNITSTLNDDLFIRLKSFEENKQNKTYYKKNMASEIAFITLDYLLTLMGGMYWLFYKFLKVLKNIFTNSNIITEEIDKNDKSNQNGDINNSISNKMKENKNKLGAEISNSNSKIINEDDTNNNLSSNISENFKENLKRITEIINNSYNKSIEEENQIINLQKRLHELRSSNKPVNKEDLYSLIRNNDQKSPSIENDKDKDISNNKSNTNIDNQKDNINENSETDQLTNKNINDNKLSISENKPNTGTLPHIVISSEDIQQLSTEKKDINNTNNKNTNDTDNINIDNNVNNNDNTNNDSKNNNKGNSVINSNISNNNLSENNNEIRRNDSNMEDIKEINRRTSDTEYMHEDTDSVIINDNKKKKFGLKLKSMMKRTRSHSVDENNTSKASLLSQASTVSKTQSIQTSDSETKEPRQKRSGSGLGRRASKILNIKYFKNKEKDKDVNKIDEYEEIRSISHENSIDIDQLISLSPYEPYKKNSLEFGASNNSNDFIANNGNKEILSRNNSIISNNGLVKDDSLNINEIGNIKEENT